MPDAILRIPLPPRGCKPGSGGHWSKRQAAKNQYQTEIWAKAQNARIRGELKPFDVPVVIDLIVNMGKTSDKRYRALDSDNAITSVAKSLFDGLVQAKVISGDSHKHVSIGSVTLNRAFREHKGEASVVITIRPQP